MTNYTPKAGLAKPLETEQANINQLNANMDKVDALLGSDVVTSTSRPSAPYKGQVIFETDTDSTLIWTGAKWDYIYNDREDVASGHTLNKNVSIANESYERPGNVADWDVTANSGLEPMDPNLALIYYTAGNGALGYRVTLPGTYLFNVAIAFRGNNTGRRYLRTQREGYGQGRITSTSFETLADSIVVRLAALEFVGFTVYQDSGGSLDVDVGSGASHFSIIRIGK